MTNREKVFSVIKNLYREDGACYQSLDRISKLSDVSKEDLCDWENNTGILYDLEFEGLVSLQSSRGKLCVCLNDDFLEDI